MLLDSIKIVTRAEEEARELLATANAASVSAARKAERDGAIFVENSRQEALKAAAEAGRACAEKTIAACAEREAAALKEIEAQRAAAELKLEKAAAAAAEKIIRGL